MPFRSITGILSVGIISGGNFLASYLMINFSSASDYGMYVFIFSGLMLAAGIQNAIVCTPMSIGAAKMEINKRNNFVSSILSFQLAFLFAALLLACMGDFLYALFDSGKLPIAISAITFLVATYLLREFLRIRGYLYQETSAILFGDIFHFILNATLLVGFAVTELSIEVVVASLCVSNLLFLFFEIIRSGIRPNLNLGSITRALNEAWQRGGKWSLPGVLATWAQNNAFVYLSGLLISVETTAMLAAIRLLLMPVNIVASGLNSVYKPAWAQRVSMELTAVRNSTLKLCISLCLILAAYVGTLALAWQYVVIYIFGGEFQAHLNLLLLWGGVFALQIIRSRESNMLQLLEEFKYLTIVGVPAAIVCLTISMVSIINFGASGALYGIIVSEVIMIVLFHRRWTRG